MEDFQKLLDQLPQDKENLNMSMVVLNTVQTLRNVGDHTGSGFEANHVASEDDPASSLRMYTQSLGGDFTTMGSPAGVQALPRSGKESPGSSLQNPISAPTEATLLTLEAKRELTRQKKQW